MLNKLIDYIPIWLPKAVVLGFVLHKLQVAMLPFTNGSTFSSQQPLQKFSLVTRRCFFLRKPASAMESSPKKDAVTAVMSINRLWYYLFIVFGFRISIDSYEDEKPTRARKFYNLCFGLIQLITNATIIAIIAIKLANKSVLDNFTVVAPLPLLSVTSILATVLFYQRQSKISSLLKKILLSASEAKQELKRIWIKLVIAMVVFGALLVGNEISEIIAGDKPVIQHIDQSLENTQAQNASNETDVSFGKELVGIYVVWAISVPYFITVGLLLCTHMCNLIALNFKIFNQRVMHFVNSNEPMTSENIDKLFKTHDAICQWAKQLSILFSPLLGMWILVHVISVCFNVRAVKLIFYSRDVNPVLHCVSYLIKDILLLYCLHKHAADVNSQAHESAFSIVSIDSDKKFSATVKHCNIKQIKFIQKFCGSNIGINVSGLYVISNGSVLSMLGLMLTYIIVLYQTS